MAAQQHVEQIKTHLIYSAMDLLVRVPLENVYFSGNINILENVFLQNLLLKGQNPAISSFPGFSVPYPRSADYHWYILVLAIRSMGWV